MQLHLSETEQEVDDCVDANGTRPAFYLDHLGLLGPRTVLAHGVWLDHAELELIAERGATVVTNPAANMKLAVGGVFPYRAGRPAGVRVGLGTDGVSSNNNLDLLEEMKLFALIQKHDAGDPAVAAGRRGRWRSPAAAARRCSAARRSCGSRPPTSCWSTPAARLSVGDLDAGLVYAARGRSSTPPSSPAGS